MTTARIKKTLAGLLSTVFIISAYAGTYTVTTNNDSGTGSLREAITLANSSPGSEIYFNLPKGSETIVLLSQLPIISTPMDIDGDTNPNNTTDSGTNVILKVQSGGKFRVFQVSPASSDVVNIEDMTIYGGDVSSYTSNMNGWGGAIFATMGTLNLTDVQIYNSKAYRGGAINCGGAPFGGNNTVVLSNCTISGNSAVWSGAIHAMNSGILKIYNSSISNNKASKFGGAICTTNNTSIYYSTVNDNTVSGTEVYGGGIAIAGATTSIDNCTIANNVANGTSAFGGGVYCESGTAIIANSTITSNTAVGTAQTGGGIYTKDNASLYMLNTITVNNASENDSGADIESKGQTFAYYCWLNSIDGNISTQTSAPNQTDNFLTGDIQQLADNGGPTKTMALDSNCPPLSKGTFVYYNSVGKYYYFIDSTEKAHKLIDWNSVPNIIVSDKITTDQRGLFRPSPSTIGAFNPAQGVPPLVQKIRPNHGQSGKKINIFGINLANTSKVMIGNNEAKISGKASANKVSVTVPAGTAGQTVNVTVTTAQGVETIFNGFTYSK